MNHYWHVPKWSIVFTEFEFYFISVEVQAYADRYPSRPPYDRLISVLHMKQFSRIETRVVKISSFNAFIPGCKKINTFMNVLITFCINIRVPEKIKDRGKRVMQSHESMIWVLHATRHDAASIEATVWRIFLQDFFSPTIHQKLVVSSIQGLIVNHSIFLVPVTTVDPTAKQSQVWQSLIYACRSIIYWQLKGKH